MNLRRSLLSAATLLCITHVTLFAQTDAQRAAQTIPQTGVDTFGPYNTKVLFGGRGVTKHLPAANPIFRANTPWTFSLWYKSGANPPASMLLASVGDPNAENARALAIIDGKPALRFGENNQIVASSTLAPNTWHLLAATSDGTQQHLFADGTEVAAGSLSLAHVAPTLEIAPNPTTAMRSFQHFGGTLTAITLTPGALTAAQAKSLFQQRPNFDLPLYEEASGPWPTPTRGLAGYSIPQDPALMPHSRGPLSTPVAKPLPPASETLKANGKATWTIANNWRLLPAPDTTATAEQISAPAFDAKKWMAATVPGTIVTTMVDRGIYPDPDFGLNNLAIPETLNKQDYWYRVEFKSPQESAAHHMAITFNGINYAAEVWLNGTRLGNIRGAFIRGTFDVTTALKPSGNNVLAVRISPPPHPGVPHEQSILAGAGDNGGQLCLDGPTFVATEGWDWIPAMRDRNSGIWQDVTLAATDQLTLGDPQVISHLPLPDITTADLELNVPVHNLGNAPANTKLTVAFEGTTFTKEVTLAPGDTTIHLTAADTPQLHVTNPRLWWPNGYGKPELYHLQLAIGDSDHKISTFGIREITYELSLFAPDGHLNRVEVSPTDAKNHLADLINVTHDGMRPTAELFASSLRPAGLTSSAIKQIPNPNELHDLVLKVNGVRIAARGGNWGMDDSRKRVSREHLEPYFKLHQLANVNMIRNWVGQDTEEVFYQLADEYGMMVWNDLWASTQDWNIEPEDVPLFLANTRDTVRRFRNHPSIIIWCARNEGVPQPILNEGLIALFDQEDGTRYYTPSSNRVNLRDSGPYSYRDADVYYGIDKGFSVELGISSLSTLESLKASMPEADQWPISDNWAYHDWHQSGNGDVAPLIQKVEAQLGAPTDLKDFERKVQMFNYVDHRAIFEGFNQHLWSPNSARMIWMTHPSWPSNMWQMYSSDYDTQASFYGVKKACEPEHVQMDLSDGTIAAVNTTQLADAGVTVRARVLSLTNQLLFTKESKLDLAANSEVNVFKLDLASLFNPNQNTAASQAANAGAAVLIKLELVAANGTTVSENLYWLAANDASYRSLNTLPAIKLDGSAKTAKDGDETVVTLSLANHGTAAALAVKATTLDSKTGERILPAYLSDNYISLLPGESRTVTIRYPTTATKQQPKIALRGWNLTEQTIPAAK